MGLSGDRMLQNPVRQEIKCFFMNRSELLFHIGNTEAMPWDFKDAIPMATLRLSSLFSYAAQILPRLFLFVANYIPKFPGDIIPQWTKPIGYLLLVQDRESPGGIAPWQLSIHGTFTRSVASSSPNNWINIRLIHDDIIDCKKINAILLECHNLLSLLLYIGSKKYI